MRPPRLPDELEIVLLLSGGSASRARLQPRVRELLGRIDYGLLERRLADRRLLPLIGSRAVEAAPDLVPESFRRAVARELEVSRARALVLDWSTHRVTALLAGAGIAALPLKGTTLGEDLHGDVGLRATSDVDLLVGRDALHDAARVLVEAGFSRPDDVLRDNDLPDLHLVLAHPRLQQVELHWRIHWYETAFAEDMLARARPGPDGLLRPAPDDLIASLLLFHSRDGFHGLRLLADITAAWDLHAAELPGAFLEGHGHRYPELRPALSAAARVVQQLAGIPATAWLGDALAGGRRVTLAVRLADWTQEGDRDQLRANISLVGGLLGPPSSGRDFAERELLSYGSGASERAGHVARMCARYALALWHVRGNRSWAPDPVHE